MSPQAWRGVLWALLLTVAGSAAAQPYEFHGVPDGGEWRAGVPLQLELRRDGGVVAEAVRISSSSDAGRFALPTGTGWSPPFEPEGWAPTLSVGDGGRFYYRDTQPATLTLLARGMDGGVRAQAPLNVLALGLSEDFEEGGSPRASAQYPGRFTQVQEPCEGGTCSLSISPDAGHRGERGLRLVDNHGPETGTQRQAHAQWRFGDSASALYLRFWFRIAESEGANTAIYLTTMEPIRDTDLHAHMEMRLLMPDRGIVASLNQKDTGAGDSSVNYGSGLEPRLQQWRLMEVAFARGTGKNWNLNAFLDGQAFNASWPIESPDLIGLVTLGESFATPNPSWTGIIDFDDVRVSFAPQPGRLAVATPEHLSPGECIPVKIELREPWTAKPAPAPYEVDMVLSVEPKQGYLPLEAAFYEEPTCAGAAVTSVRIPRLEGSRALFFRAPRRGWVRLRASHLDFLSTSLDQPVRDSARPFASISPELQEIPLEGAASLSASDSLPTPGAALAGFRWELAEGPGPGELLTAASTASFVPSEPGTYRVRLIVSDTAGREDWAYATVRVAGDAEVPPRQQVGWGCQSLPLPLSGAVLALLWALSLRRRRPGSSGG